VPRATTKPSVMLCLSISATARAMMVPLRMVHQLLDEDKLVLKQIGNARRIPVSSIADYINSLPDIKRKGVPNGQS
jgi:hypothetical protein